MLKNKNIFIKILPVIVLVFSFSLIFYIYVAKKNTEVINAQGPYIDIGLRLAEKVDDYTNEIVPIAIEMNPNLSPLKIAKNGTIYGVSLVDPSDPSATKARIKLISGVVKALRRFTEGKIFNDQSAFAQGYCSGNKTKFSATITIKNTSSQNANFIATRHEGSGGYPQIFIVQANQTVVKGGFGYLEYPADGCFATPPLGTEDGSATYEVLDDAGNLLQAEVTYSWWYNH